MSTIVDISVLRGFVKLNKSKNPRKPQLGFLFILGNFVFLWFFCVVFMCPNVSKKMDSGVGGTLSDQSVFFGFLDFFKLHKG